MFRTGCIEIWLHIRRWSVICEGVYNTFPQLLAQLQNCQRRQIFSRALGVSPSNTDTKRSGRRSELINEMFPWLSCHQASNARGVSVSTSRTHALKSEQPRRHDLGLTQEKQLAKLSQESRSGDSEDHSVPFNSGIQKITSFPSIQKFRSQQQASSELRGNGRKRLPDEKRVFCRRKVKTPER